jgi:hypothetical protein
VRESYKVFQSDFNGKAANVLFAISLSTVLRQRAGLATGKLLHGCTAKCDRRSHFAEHATQPGVDQ